ncbi:hypothetical protein [Bradyrhizobium sp. CCGUVB23]|uniref:hypothetical protein n=1 Tax=Bradyrhizobium sp. CCGUVB23 TaxID=2949630 RepID=UPI0020B24A8C|nr:hypothetical protein [Bradyrhizobium sp. CCGUVB23]MCP3463959.1 hypothetical protein [Bradyrhizobium sp. CCGUVB23]
MSRIWFVVWAIIVVQVAAWAFAPDPKAPQAPASDGPGYGSSEKYSVDARVSQRADAIAALERPYGARCTDDGRKQFIGGLNEYYYQRQNQMERYPETFGKPGADYIARQWSTGEDQRIDRLTQEAYAQGYLKLSDLNNVARKMVEAVVRNERVIAKACAG